MIRFTYSDHDKMLAIDAPEAEEIRIEPSDIFEGSHLRLVWSDVRDGWRVMKKTITGDGTKSPLRTSGDWSEVAFINNHYRKEKR